MNSDATPNRHFALLFWAVAVALLFYKLGATAPWQSEDRWLEIAREMIDSGNYFAPTINHTVYFDKPLFSYWLEVVAALFTGGINEFSMRLPSAVAALVALWATIDLGRRLWSDRIGTLAGWILLTGLGFLQWGRLAEADMENLAATIAAVSWYWRRRERPDFLGYLVFYLIIAIGAQCKGLAAIIVPAIAVLPDLLKNKRWKSNLTHSHFFALAIAIGVYLLPFILANASGVTPQNAGHNVAPAEGGIGLVIRENVIRYFAPFDHTGPIYTYLLAIPRFVFPWSPVLIAALIAACWKIFPSANRPIGKDTDSNLHWMLWAIALTFLFFTLSGSRRHYYILPILPYCALLTAHFLHGDQFPRLRRWSLNIALALLVLLGLLQAITPLIWWQLESRIGANLPLEIRTLCVTVGTLSLCALLGSLWGFRRHRDGRIVAIIVSSIIIWGGFFFAQQLVLDSYRTEAPFARALKPLAAQLDAQNKPLEAALYRDRPLGRMLYYSNLRLPIQKLSSAEQLQQFAATPPYPKLILVRMGYNNELPEFLRNREPDLTEQQYPWEKSTRDKMQAWRINERPDFATSIPTTLTTPSNPAPDDAHDDAE